MSSAVTGVNERGRLDCIEEEDDLEVAILEVVELLRLITYESKE